MYKLYWKIQRGFSEWFQIPLKRTDNCWSTSWKFPSDSTPLIPFASLLLLLIFFALRNCGQNCWSSQRPQKKKVSKSCMWSRTFQEPLRMTVSRKTARLYVASHPFQRTDLVIWVQPKSNLHHFNRQPPSERSQTFWIFLRYRMVL